MKTYSHEDLNIHSFVHNKELETTQLTDEGINVRIIVTENNKQREASDYDSN